MNIKSRTLTATEEQALADSLLDIQEWVDGAIDGKVNNCKTRMIQKWYPILLADPDIKSMPSTESGLISKIVNYSEYKNRATLEAEAEAARKAEEAAAAKAAEETPAE